MKTAFENNIKSHYTNHARCLVNKSFKQGSLSKKEFNNQLSAVKRDLFNGTLESPEQYHEWIQTHRNRIIPPDHDIENLYTYPQR